MKSANIGTVKIGVFNGPSKCRATGYLSVITLGSDHWYTAPCPGPWVQASVTTNSFLDLSTISMLSSWFYLVYLIWYYYLSVNFVVWIVKQKIENKWNLFKKIWSLQNVNKTPRLPILLYRHQNEWKCLWQYFFRLSKSFFCFSEAFGIGKKYLLKVGPKKILSVKPINRFTKIYRIIR